MNCFRFRKIKGGKTIRLKSVPLVYPTSCIGPSVAARTEQCRSEALEATGKKKSRPLVGIFFVLFSKNY